ncbi:MAG: hypothetical protein HZA89_01700 [Verrucomicrobia bacterium]|nr:hypothetical protein [Verrucomicrobiota bacterium]
MIQLRSDCLALQGDSGDAIPCSAEKITVQIVGGPGSHLDTDIVEHAVAAVLHYFREEQGREFVSMGEFTLALERVLKGFGFELKTQKLAGPPAKVEESDLRQLACDAGKGFELTFFPKLRAELLDRLGRTPQYIRFTGLRSCVKQITGARRWSRRCQNLNDQIVEFARHCLQDGSQGAKCALVVE